MRACEVFKKLKFLCSVVLALWLFGAPAFGVENRAQELEKMLAAEQVDWQEVRVRLLEMEDGVAFVTNRIRSPIYRVATRGMESLCYSFSGDPTERAKEFVRRALPGLIDCFSSTNTAVRSRALWMVGDLGGNAEPAVEPLIRVITSKEPEPANFIIRKSAVRSLGLIARKPEACLPVLGELFDHSDPQLARMAIDAVGRFESSAVALKPRLQAIAASTNEELAKAAKSALERLELPRRPQAGDSAPGLNLPFVLVEGGLDLQKLRGQLVYLDFWATTCAPCIPALEKCECLIEKHGNAWRGKVAVVAVAMDEDLKLVQTQIKKKGWGKVTHLWGGNATNVARAYRVGGVPDTLLIGPDGVILWRGHPNDCDLEMKAMEWVRESR
jgi:thiol-disulfide isomerase/thioredoxin